MAAGAWPRTRHDGAPFGEEERFRLEQSDKRFPHKSMIMFLKGDWVEFSERLGYPSHSHSLRPCFCCSVAPGPAMYNPRGVSVHEQSWHNNTVEDFDEAIRSCETTVVLTAPLHRQILRALRYDRRKAGSFGRTLIRDIPEAHLLQGDRLEAGPTIPDVADFDRLSTFPCRVSFWRPSMSYMLHFRSPLWDNGLGLNPVDTPALDLLHTLYLGPMQQWVLACIWCLLDSNVLSLNAPTEYEGKLLTLASLKVYLDTWYNNYDHTHRNKPCTRLQKLTAKMVGSGKAHRTCSFKAMETYVFMRFLVDFLPTYVDATGCAVLFAAGQALAHFMDTLKEAPAVITPTMCTKLLDIWKRFMILIEPLEIYTPKAHLMYHLILRSVRQGNPVLYQTFTDEGLNSSVPYGSATNLHSNPWQWLSSTESSDAPRSNDRH